MKRDSRTRYSAVVAVLLLAGAIGTGCNVREPGCLDIEARNFDFDAGRNDPELCVYPNLVLNVVYQWADSTLQLDYLYENASGMHYAIKSVQVLLSDFVVHNVDGEMLTIDQKVSLTTGSCDGGTVLDVPDDFVFVDRTAFNYAIGAFRTSGYMEDVRFRTGVPENYTPLCIDDLPPTHKLTMTRAGYDPVIGDFALGRFVISRDSLAAEPDTIFAYGTGQELTFDLLRDFHRGSEDTLYLNIDFFQLFDQLDLSTSHVEIGNALAQQIAGSMTMR